MTKQILGVDVDGVLANFVDAFADLLAACAGHDRMPNPREYPVWDWPKAFGYTKTETDLAWAEVEASTFWQTLEPYPETAGFGVYLNERLAIGDDVYFITDRRGRSAKVLTERWIRWHLKTAPTVLICKHKGMAARALKLTHYIDDKVENVIDVVGPDGCYAHHCKVFLRDRPWNQGVTIPSVTRIEEIVGFAE